MRKIIRTAVGVLALAAAGYVGFNAWLAWGLPPTPYEPPAKACVAKKEVRDGVRYSGAYYACLADMRDAAVLKAFPRLATRDGANLTINYAGKPVAHLIPRPAGSQPSSAWLESCEEFKLIKAIAVRDPATHALEPLAVVVCRDGSMYMRALVRPDGTLTIIEDIFAAPDGRTVALGSEDVYVSGQSGFILRDWASQADIAAFAPGCRVIEWTDATHLTASCVYDLKDNKDPGKGYETAVAFEARIWRDNTGIWQMQATRWLDFWSHIDTQRDADHPPAFSLRPLPHFTAKPASQNPHVARS